MRYIPSLFAAAALAALLVLAPSGGMGAGEPAPRPSILLITADDMNCDSVGAFGCPVARTTPHLDKLAGEGLRFLRAHVTIAVCQPCRSVLMTGQYPHRSGGEGFHKIRRTETPTLVEELDRAGYLCGILGKAGHSTPKSSIAWDMRHDMGELGRGRDPGRYGGFARDFFERARKEDRPFFLMANSHDPHRPFSGSDQEKRAFRGAAVTPPSRIFRPEEVRVPGFLPDLPQVRLEIAEYYSSVRRCDDTVGALLSALESAGRAQDTLVVYFSDHGMPLPYAKTNCYLHSTRTPWIVRWPGRVKAGSTDGEHFISGVDLMPTLLEAAGVPLPEGMDGRSFLALLEGRRQSGRDRVFTQFHQTSARRRFPMRCVQTAELGYIFNPWSDGQRVFRNESQSGRTFAAMRAAGEKDPAIQKRVDFFLHRTVEELYDLEEDPDCLHNLAGDPEHRDELEKMRSSLAEWMERTEDPALEALRNRGSPEALDRFMEEQDREARAGTPPRRARAKARKKAESTKS